MNFILLVLYIFVAAATEFFWDKMTKGAIMLLDDYGWQGFDEQHDASSKFAKERSVLILSLPTSQGLILKP